MTAGPCVSMIAALARNRVIGVKNQLPWSIPEDLKRFRQITTGHSVIMGRKTYESIGRVLPGRRFVIVTRRKDFKVEGALVVNSLESAIESCSLEKEIFIIGGAEIYAQALPIARRLYLTLIDREVDGDAFFPAWDEGQYREIEREDRDGYRFVTLETLEGK